MDPLTGSLIMGVIMSGLTKSLFSPSKSQTQVVPQKSMGMDVPGFGIEGTTDMQGNRAGAVNPYDQSSILGQTTSGLSNILGMYLGSQLFGSGGAGVSNLFSGGGGMQGSGANWLLNSGGGYFPNIFGG